MGLANLAQQDVYLGPMANLYYVCKNVYNELTRTKRNFTTTWQWMAIVVYKSTYMGVNKLWE